GFLSSRTKADSMLRCATRESSASNFEGKVNAAASTLKENSKTSPLVAEAMNSISLLSSLINSKVVAVKRGKNRVAHGLVGLARNIGTMLRWGNVPEPVFLSFVMIFFLCNE
ncbi:hypothetical protein L195_g043892, partial [Trifolium pratense]